MGEGARLSLGLLTGDLARWKTGEGALRIVKPLLGDGERRPGAEARRNLGLEPGERASASRWILVVIRTGGASNLVGLMIGDMIFLRGKKGVFFGLLCSEGAGLVPGEPGVRVSELVVELTAKVTVGPSGLPPPFLLLVVAFSLSRSRSRSRLVGVGTSIIVSHVSVLDSPGTPVNVMQVVGGEVSRGEMLEQASERVSQEAIGASLGLGG